MDLRKSGEIGVSLSDTNNYCTIGDTLITSCGLAMMSPILFNTVPLAVPSFSSGAPVKHIISMLATNIICNNNNKH